MSERLGRALQILDVLSDVPFPGITRGEIRNRVDAPADTEITARIRELRDREGYGEFDIRVDQSGKEWRYYMLYRERQRAKRFLSSWKARKAA